MTDAWERGDYVEAVTRAGLEIGTLAVAVTKLAQAARAARAARAVEAANVADDVGRAVGSVADDVADDAGKAAGTNGVRITPKTYSVGFRRDHILNRHRHGANKPKKTEFPENWDDDKIIREVESVANDPNSVRGTGPYGEQYSVGVRDGIEIRVDHYPPDHPRFADEISTAYPLNTNPNP